MVCIHVTVILANDIHKCVFTKSVGWKSTSWKSSSDVHDFVRVSIHLVLGMWYCSSQLSGLGERLGSDVTIVEVGLQTDLQVYLQLRQTWMILCKLPSDLCRSAGLPVTTYCILFCVYLSSILYSFYCPFVPALESVFGLLYNFSVTLFHQWFSWQQWRRPSCWCWSFSGEGSVWPSLYSEKLASMNTNLASVIDYYVIPSL